MANGVSNGVKAGDVPVWLRSMVYVVQQLGMPIAVSGVLLYGMFCVLGPSLVRAHAQFLDRVASEVSQMREDQEGANEHLMAFTASVSKEHQAQGTKLDAIITLMGESGE